MHKNAALILLASFLGAMPPCGWSAEPSSAPPEAPREIDPTDINLGYPDADERQVLALIAELGHADFAAREKAAAELTALCPGAFRMMARVFRESDDFEVRLRIEDIARERFLWYTLLRTYGFLGVAYETHVVAGLPEGASAVLVKTVEPGTAAEIAGIRPNDLIVAVDGKPVTEGIDGAPFNEVIQGKGAGGIVRLDVIRGQARMVLEVRLQARPLADYLRSTASSQLLDAYNQQLRAYTLWRARHFSLPPTVRERTPSSAVIELPR